MHPSALDIIESMLCSWDDAFNDAEYRAMRNFGASTQRHVLDNIRNFLRNRANQEAKDTLTNLREQLQPEWEYVTGWIGCLHWTYQCTLEQL